MGQPTRYLHGLVLAEYLPLLSHWTCNPFSKRLDMLQSNAIDLGLITGGRLPQSYSYRQIPGSDEFGVASFNHALRT